MKKYLIPENTLTIVLIVLYTMVLKTCGPIALA
jgi:hypothetical protein